MDPRTSVEERERLCESMAREAVQEEMSSRRSQTASSGSAPPAEQAREVPPIKASRHRLDEEDPGSSVPTGEPPRAKEALESRGPGHHWRRMVQLIQERERWSIRGTAINYSRNGMPRSVDGPARGLGRHIGRWGWREIRATW